MTGPRHGIDPELTDGWLRLRRPTLHDVPAITAACQDLEIQRWTTVPAPYTEEHSVDWIQNMVLPGWERGDRAEFLVTDAAAGTLLGACGLGGIDRDNAVGEIGFWAAAPARGRGVTTAALRLVCRWAFDELGLARIGWRAYVPNHGSRRVAERCGFTIEGRLRSSYVQRGQRVDEWVAGLLPGELR